MGGKSFFASTKNKILVAAGVIIILFAALWIWKAVEIKNLKKENEKKETLLKQKANELLLQSDYRYLKLLAKPYVWAILTEMMKGNIEAVNLYADDMVKEKNFQTITVVDDKGMVISSTNKKLEGKSYASVGNAAYLSNHSTLVNKVDAAALEVSSPVSVIKPKDYAVTIQTVQVESRSSSVQQNEEDTKNTEKEMQSRKEEVKKKGA